MNQSSFCDFAAIGERQASAPSSKDGTDPGSTTSASFGTYRMSASLIADRPPAEA
jgi:hypothetical protein